MGSVEPAGGCGDITQSLYTPADIQGGCFEDLRAAGNGSWHLQAPQRLEGRTWVGKEHSPDHAERAGVPGAFSSLRGRYTRGLALCLRKSGNSCILQFVRGHHLINGDLLLSRCRKDENRKDSQPYESKFHVLNSWWHPRLSPKFTARLFAMPTRAAGFGHTVRLATNKGHRPSFSIISNIAEM